MTLKLEVGKKYLRRNGRVATVTRACGEYFCAKCSHHNLSGIMHHPDGRWAGNARFFLGADEDDLVAEYVEPTDAPAKPSIVDEAVSIVNGARRKAYGTPEDNFERIARFWNAYFQNTGREVSLTAADVSPMMRLMKEARLTETPNHRDSHVDLIGYTLTGARINGVDGA